MAVCGLMLGIAAIGLPGTANASLTHPNAVCEESHTSVRITEGGPETYSIYGELCLPKGRTPETVQFTLPGGTYTHVYWDFPFQPERYSYVEHMTNAGFATFNIDRIANGNSSHPLGALVSAATNGLVTHQLIQALRDGTLGPSFEKVVLAGHSYGSTVSFDVTRRFPDDVDGLIITGMVHKLSPGFTAAAQGLAWPALLEPRFSHLDPTYLSTRPGARTAPFYEMSNADQRVVDTDEATKGTITAPELATFPSYLLDGTTGTFRVPVLVVMGQKDVLFCDNLLGSNCSTKSTLYDQEKHFYHSEAQLETFVLPNAGHDINLHLNATDWFDAAEDWMTRRFPN